MVASQSLPIVPSVDPIEADALCADGALMIDVREPGEWRVARIDGADLLPMSSIRDWWQDLPRDRTVIVQCRTGARSAMVVHALIEQADFEDVHNLAGGIEAWALAGLAVDTTPPDRI